MFESITKHPGGALSLLVLSVVLLLWLAGDAQARQAPPRETGTYVDEAHFWSGIRHAQAGRTSAAAPQSGVLISDLGETWRTARNGYVSAVGKWALAVSLSVLAVFFLVHGRIRLEGGRSGETVERWSRFSRYLHWYVAVLFLALLATGLLLLFGKYVVTPLVGKSAMAAVASVGKVVHNYGGPLFVIGLALMVAAWFRRNIITRVDLRWFARGGGFFGKGHPSAGFVNGGEKVWFWLLTLGGTAVCVTGLILVFPNFGQARELMQQAHILHVLSGLLLAAVAFGHIYIATLGTEGALEGMVGGRVDSNWAKQHHDLWYEEVSRAPRQ